MLLDVISQELTYLPKFVTGKNSSIYALNFHSHPICILSCIYPPNSMEWRALPAATPCKFTRRSRFVTLFIILFRVFFCAATLVHFQKSNCSVFFNILNFDSFSKLVAWNEWYNGLLVDCGRDEE
jgi:hypothetical protein